MRKIKKKILLLLVLVLTIVGTGFTVHAAETVKTVKVVRTYKNYKEYCTIKGYGGSGKTVWSYKCTSSTATELSHVSIKTKGNTVYVIDGRNYIRLNKQTGKVIKKKTKVFKHAVGSATMFIDSSGYLYAIGYYDNLVYKVNKSGKVVWKTKISVNDAYWPYKMKLSGKSLTIYFDGTAKYKKATLNIKTGKITKYGK